jgi:hypothetical protein
LCPFANKKIMARYAQAKRLKDAVEFVIMSESNCSVHPQINIKFQKVNWAVMSNNKP